MFFLYIKFILDYLYLINILVLYSYKKIQIIILYCFDIHHLFNNFVYTDCFIFIIQQNNNNTNSNPEVDNQNLIENNMVKFFIVNLIL